jgi:hypothetical protein
MPYDAYPVPPSQEYRVQFHVQDFDEPVRPPEPIDDDFEELFINEYNISIAQDEVESPPVPMPDYLHRVSEVFERRFMNECTVSSEPTDDVPEPQATPEPESNQDTERPRSYREYNPYLRDGPMTPTQYMMAVKERSKKAGWKKLWSKTNKKDEETRKVLEYVRERYSG